VFVQLVHSRRWSCHAAGAYQLQPHICCVRKAAELVGVVVQRGWKQEMWGLLACEQQVMGCQGLAVCLWPTYGAIHGRSLASSLAVLPCGADRGMWNVGRQEPRTTMVGSTTLPLVWCPTVADFGRRSEAGQESAVWQCC
jgi:hypothetical protein